MRIFHLEGCDPRRGNLNGARDSDRGILDKNAKKDVQLAHVGVRGTMCLRIGPFLEIEQGIQP